MNELQDKFKNRNDLMFLSLSNESKEKIRSKLKRVEFKTIVVSDQTNQTELNFNVVAIPHTVLIDNKGIVKWIGQPNDLTSEMIDGFLSGQKITSKIDQFLLNEKENNVETKFEINNRPQSILDLVNDNNTKYIFSVQNAEKSNSSTSSYNINKGKFVELNYNLNTIIAKIIDKPISQIIISENLANNKYNVIYKNTNFTEANEHLKLIKSSLLTSLNLTENIKIKKIDAYILKLIDKNKLEISENQKGQAIQSNNDTQFEFFNASTEKFIEVMGNYYKIIIINETGLKENIDLEIKKGDLKQFENELLKNGFFLEKVLKEVEFYHYK